VAGYEGDQSRKIKVTTGLAMNKIGSGMMVARLAIRLVHLPKLVKRWRKRDSPDKS